MPVDMENSATERKLIIHVPFSGSSDVRYQISVQMKSRYLSF